MCAHTHIHKNRMKSSYDAVISAVDFFKQWDPSIATQRSLWTTREIRLKNKPHLVTFHESVLVSLQTLQLTLIYI